MNARRCAVALVLGIGLLVGLVAALGIPSQPVHAQTGGESDLTSLSKSEVGVEAAQPLFVTADVGAANVGNGDFENGADGTWTEYSAQGWPLISDAATLSGVSVTPHSGQYAVWLGGDDDETATITQTVTIASGESTLNYWTWIGSEDACGYDYARVLIDNTEHYSFCLCSNTRTGGWVKRSLDLDSYIGQDVELQFRVDTDSTLNSNFFLDDVVLGQWRYVYLPAVDNDSCQFHYFDDFSNPASGWWIADDAVRTYGYVNGEYQMLRKLTHNDGMVGPDTTLPANYRVEVDVRIASTAKGDVGLFFGARQVGYDSEWYQFLIYPPNQEYFLAKLSLDGSWTTLIDWTYDSDIHVSKSNHLRVYRYGTGIWLYANGMLLEYISDGSFTGAGREAGLRIYSGDSAPFDVRFDNFRMDCLP